LRSGVVDSIRVFGPAPQKIAGQARQLLKLGYAGGICWQPSSRASLDAAAGAVEEVARIVGQIRNRWPKVRIVLRADSGFARDELMAWCEANGVHFVFGLAKNDRLIAEIKDELAAAEKTSRRTGKPARRFKQFKWTTRRSWSRERRVVPKAEWTQGEANPRFIVTSLMRAECKASYLYEKVYCARGDMENRIKECQLDLYADRTSTATLRANQLRLWFYSMAYVLLAPCDASAWIKQTLPKQPAAPFASSC
jgi:Transposase DDE domain group 1